MTDVFRSQWPYNDPVLRDLRFAQRLGLLHPDDQPAALGMQPDEDGCLHCGPFTIDDAAAWAARLLDDESEALD
jgi:hypothetical protein